METLLGDSTKAKEKLDSTSKYKYAEKVKLKEQIFSYILNNRELSKHVNLDEKTIGRIRKQTIWLEIEVSIELSSQKTSPMSKYNYAEQIAIKKIIFDNSNLMLKDLVKLTPLSKPIVSKISEY